jgi:hypothetical protein
MKISNSMQRFKLISKDINQSLEGREHCRNVVEIDGKLMGPKSLDSTVGTKPTTEAQLDSAVFKMEWFSRSCDPTDLSMGFVFLCEGSSFS